MADDSTSRSRMSAPRRERRRHPRAITSFSAELTAGGRRYATRVINLSMGGALLDFRQLLPYPAINLGDRVSVIIRCRGTAEPFATDGTAVLWNLISSSEPLLAIQFDEVTGEPAERLEELIAEALAHIGGRGGLTMPPQS